MTYQVDTDDLFNGAVLGASDTIRIGVKYNNIYTVGSVAYYEFREQEFSFSTTADQTLTFVDALALVNANNVANQSALASNVMASTALNGNNARLTLSNSDITWPTTGGVSITDLGTVRIQDDNNNDTGWPANASTVNGENAAQWTYSAGNTRTAGTSTGLDNALTNNTGATVTVRRMDVDYTVTGLPDGITGHVSPQIFANVAGSGVAGGSREASSGQRLTMTLHSTNETTGTFNIANGQSLSFGFSETTTGDRPFNVEIHAVRVSYTTDTFTTAGTGLTVGVGPNIRLAGEADDGANVFQAIYNSRATDTSPIFEFLSGSRVQFDETRLDGISGNSTNANDGGNLPVVQNILNWQAKGAGVLSPDGSIVTRSAMEIFIDQNEIASGTDRSDLAQAIGQIVGTTNLTERIIQLQRNDKSKTPPPVAGNIDYTDI